MALISLEDLEGLDDEQQEDDITDNQEPMVEDDQLLSHWQAVASTHQVSVPRGVCMCACSRSPPHAWFTLVHTGHGSTAKRPLVHTRLMFLCVSGQEICSSAVVYSTSVV